MYCFYLRTQVHCINKLCKFVYVYCYYVFQGHLRDGYGKLISAYTTLLNQKLAFHRKVRQSKQSMLVFCQIYY